MKEYVNIKRLSENVFYLNRKGHEIIGSEKKTFHANMQIEHILMRNELIIYLQPKKYQIEQPLIDSQGSILIRPDALFLFDKWMFIEIDNIQKMIINKRKIEKYAEINNSKMLHKSLGYFPKLIFLTKSEKRKERLIKLCSERNICHNIYLLEEIK